MSTLVDELLQDFDDSGSEQDGEGSNDGLRDIAAVNGSHEGDNMDADGDGGGSEEDVDMCDDLEEAKTRVEKIRWSEVKDVHSVADLMTQLEPVLEVRMPS